MSEYTTILQRNPVQSMCNAVTSLHNIQPAYRPCRPDMGCHLPVQSKVYALRLLCYNGTMLHKTRTLQRLSKSFNDLVYWYYWNMILICPNSFINQSCMRSIQQVYMHLTQTLVISQHQKKVSLCILTIIHTLIHKISLVHVASRLPCFFKFIAFSRYG